MSITARLHQRINVPRSAEAEYQQTTLGRAVKAAKAPKAGKAGKAGKAVKAVKAGKA
jgi:hypothetical protein